MNFPGNPHSRSHGFGWTTEDIIENARGHVADVINGDAKDIIFTSVPYFFQIKYYFLTKVMVQSQKNYEQT